MTAETLRQTARCAVLVVLVGVAAVASARGAFRDGDTALVEGASSLSVETVGVEPTVAMTGDRLRVTYRLRFRDLTKQGKEIVVLEDRLAPDKVTLAPFDAIGLDIDKRQFGDEHVWDVSYTLRIVSPVKEVQELSRVTFFWLIRDHGQRLEDAQVLQADSTPLQVRYVTTITDDAMVDVRDEVELGSLRGRTLFFRGVAWVIAPAPLVIWTVAVIRAARRPREPQHVRQFLSAGIPESPVEAIPSRPEVRRQLVQALHRLTASGSGANGTVSPEVLSELVVSLREFLLVHEPTLNPGDTARDIQRALARRPGSDRRIDSLRGLSTRLVSYQHALEHGTAPPIGDGSAEARECLTLMNGVGWRKRMVAGLTALSRR